MISLCWSSQRGPNVLCFLCFVIYCKWKWLMFRNPNRIWKCSMSSFFQLHVLMCVYILQASWWKSRCFGLYLFRVASPYWAQAWVTDKIWFIWLVWVLCPVLKHVMIPEFLTVCTSSASSGHMCRHMYKRQSCSSMIETGVMWEQGGSTMPGHGTTGLVWAPP